MKEKTLDEYQSLSSFAISLDRTFICPKSRGSLRLISICRTLKDIIALIDKAMTFTDRLEDDAAGTHDNLAAALNSAREEMDSKKRLESDDVVGHVAFWGYDLFPYVLSGTVLKAYGNGVYKMASGSIYQCFLVLPPELGQPIVDNLKRLHEAYSDARDKLHADFMEDVYCVFPQFREHRVKEDR